MPIDVSYELQQLDQRADLLEALVLDYISPDQMNDFDDWRTYFHEARKDPGDQWIHRKATQTLCALLGVSEEESQQDLL